MRLPRSLRPAAEPRSVFSGLLIVGAVFALIDVIQGHYLLAVTKPLAFAVVLTMVAFAGRALGDFVFDRRAAVRPEIPSPERSIGDSVVGANQLDRVKRRATTLVRFLRQETRPRSPLYLLIAGGGLALFYVGGGHYLSAGVAATVFAAVTLGGIAVGNLIFDRRRATKPPR